MYDAYLQAIRDELSSGSKDLSFKSNWEYRNILEHVRPYEGDDYLRQLAKDFPAAAEATSDVLGFCRLNDAIGRPNVAYYDELDESVSPTSLRYVYHAHVILKHIVATWPKDLPLKIVEVGGGYGGLCLAMFYFAAKFGVTIESYAIVDLTDVLRLQDRYLSDDRFAAVVDRTRIEFHDAQFFGQTVGGGGAAPGEFFMISNYAYSEIPYDLRVKYTEHLIAPKVRHGFLVWNFCEVHDFGRPILRIEEERPKSYDNRFVYF